MTIFIAIWFAVAITLGPVVGKYLATRSLPLATAPTDRLHQEECA